MPPRMCEEAIDEADWSAAAEREIGHIDWQPIAKLAKPRQLTLRAVHTQEA
jgi:hypothetical protein